MKRLMWLVVLACALCACAEDGDNGEALQSATEARRVALESLLRVQCSCGASDDVVRACIERVEGEDLGLSACQSEALEALGADAALWARCEAERYDYEATCAAPCDEWVTWCLEGYTPSIECEALTPARRTAVESALSCSLP
jgi:hypothetical protein